MRLILPLVSLILTISVGFALPQRKTGYIPEEVYTGGDSNKCANCVAAFSEVRNIPLTKIDKGKLGDKIFLTCLRAPLKVNVDSPFESLEVFSLFADLGGPIMEQLTHGSKAVDAEKICVEQKHCPADAAERKKLMGKDVKKFRNALHEFIVSTKPPPATIVFDESEGCPVRKNGVAAGVALKNGDHSNACANCIFAMKEVKATPIDELDKRKIRLKVAESFGKGLGKNIAFGLVLATIPGGQPFALPAAIGGATKDAACTVLDEMGPAVVEYIRTGAYHRNIEPESYCIDKGHCPRDLAQLKIMKHADTKGFAKYWAMFKLGSAYSMNG